jgi:adenylate cyclase
MAEAIVPLSAEGELRGRGGKSGGAVLVGLDVSRGLVPVMSRVSKRKTQIVMAGDIAGYSRLMEADEDDTHSRMLQLNADVIRPIVAGHDGQLVKHTGDGFLAAFDAPIPAIRSAIALQTKLVEGAAAFPPERRIVFRLGLNICEAIIEVDDIFGDGVNVAARLQAYAEPGDIIMTAELARLAPSELAAAGSFDLGELQLRNISRAIHAFGIRIGSMRNLAAPAPTRVADPRPSIAVLPFRKAGRGRVDIYVAEAIVEEVIHGLAGTQGLVVISRGSTRRYGRKDIDTREIGRELNVRYVLSGGIQRAGDKLRVNTELAEAETGQIIRHDRFDGGVTKLLQLEEQIAVTALKTIAPDIVEREVRRSMRKQPENLSAYELVLRALEPLFRLDRESHARARGLLQQAIALDPGYAPAYTYTAYWHIFRVGEGWSTDVAADGREAVRMAQAAIERDPKDGLALAISGHVQSFLLHDFETGNAILERAIAVAPNCAMAWSMSSVTRGYLGDSAGAVQRAEIGLRLSPLDGHAFWNAGMLAQARYLNGDYEAAVAWARRAAAQNPVAMFNLRILAAALVALGRDVAASRIAGEILARNPDFCLSAYAKTCPFRGQVLADWLKRLCAAGLPNDPRAS